MPVVRRHMRCLPLSSRAGAFDLSSNSSKRPLRPDTIGRCGGWLELACHPILQKSGLCGNSPADLRRRLRDVYRWFLLAN